MGSLQTGDVTTTGTYFYVEPSPPGRYEITGVADGIALAKKLVLVISDPVAGTTYNQAAWYEEDVTPAVSAFWTGFKHSLEVA